jgi:radical SAM superfamily enzyme YgiQ (UPF0313 family)
MKTKVLMVYPETPETFWSFRHSLKFVGKKANFPPLGLLTVAALLPENYDVRIVDMNVRALRDSDISGSDLVFVSAMLVQKESMEKVIKRCNGFGKPVVAGGPYPTSSWESIEGVDHFVLNEAELTLPEFIEDLEAGMPGKLYRSEAKPDLSMTPIPRYDLIDPRPYSAMVLQYSRGCPFSCEFCEIIELFGRTPRVKPAAQFMGEVDALYRLGYRGSIFIVDDNFIGNKASVKAVLRLLVAWQEDHGKPFQFSTEASVDLAKDEELLDLMARAGFKMAFVGIETPVRESLEGAHKRQNLGLSLVESVHRIQEKGIEVTGGFIVGFDSDPEDIADRQIEFIRDSGITTAMVGLLTALPNTQLYRRLQAENRILGESKGNNTHLLEVNFVPQMEKAALIAAYVKVLTTIYDPRVYFDRCLSLLERLPEETLVNPNLASLRSLLMNGRALILSLVGQSLSPYGREYLRFLAATLRRFPRFFPKAIEMAIYGHNFFTITRVQVRDKWEFAAKLGLVSDRVVEWIRTLPPMAAPAGMEKVFEEIRELRARIADIVRLAGSNPEDAEIVPPLSSLVSAVRNFIDERSGRIAAFVPSESGPRLRAFARTVDRYRARSTTGRSVTGGVKTGHSAGSRPGSVYAKLLAVDDEIDAMIVRIGSIALAGFSVR